VKNNVKIFIGWAVCTLFFMLLALFYLSVRDFNNAIVAIFIVFFSMLASPIFVNILLETPTKR